MSEQDSVHTTGNTTTGGTFRLESPPRLEDFKPKDQPPLSSLGPYQIRREIGRGAMGTVYEAVHSQLQRTVALKVLPPELAESANRLQRFRREMAAIGRLEHPNIVLATDAGDADGLCYIAMQFIDGRDLDVVLSEVGRFDPADACEIIRQTALGLQHIHEQRLVHRDIKPANLVLTKKGEIKILDLGIAMLRNIGDRETSMTAAGSLMGTPDYIAPEQITQCFDVDIRADIYSLGCTLYGLLSGKPPFTGPGYTTFTAKLLGHSDRQPPALGEMCPEVPTGIVDLVERMMAKNRDERPALPIDVADSLVEFCQHADLVPIACGQIHRKRSPAPTAATFTPKKPDRKSALGMGRRTIAFGALAACLIAAAAFWATRHHSNLAGLDSSGAHASEAPTITTMSPATTAIDPVGAIAASNQAIANNTSQIAGTLDQMRQQFERALIDSSTLENPRTPADHYFNARIHSQRGDYLKARKSYLAYFANELPVADPHLQFIQLLKLQEGIAGARELYAELPGEKDVPARRLATAMLNPSEQRIVLLERLIEDEQDYAPAWYQLSREYSSDRNPKQTLSDQVRQKELLEKFMRLHNSGKLLKFYLDQSHVTAMLTDAQQRLKQLANVDLSAAKNPVKFALALPMGREWKLGFGIAEGAIEIQYRVGEQGEFKSTGTTGVFIGGVETIDARTGKPMPNTYVDLPETPKCTIYVQYIDSSSTLRGPYPLEFDPDLLRGKWQRSSLEQSKREWLMLQDERLVFTLFHIGREQIESVHYGLDEESPNRAKSVPQASINENNGLEFSVPVPLTVKFATIQVVYKDGTQSEIVKIQRRR